MVVGVLVVDDRMGVVGQVAVSLGGVLMERRVGIDVVVRHLVTVLVVLVRVVRRLVRRRRRRRSRVLGVRRRRGVAVGQWPLVVAVSTGLRRVVLALGRWSVSRGWLGRAVSVARVCVLARLGWVVLARGRGRVLVG